MTRQQADVAEKIMKARGVPRFSALIDAAMVGDLAFTDQQTNKAWINAKKFVNAPHSWQNTVLHEAGHLCGAQHGDGSTAMSYAVTLDQAGNVVDDSFYLMPLPQ